MENGDQGNSKGGIERGNNRCPPAGFLGVGIKAGEAGGLGYSPAVAELPMEAGGCGRVFFVPKRRRESARRKPDVALRILYGQWLSKVAKITKGWTSRLEFFSG